jgi:hypothetical protein
MKLWKMKKRSDLDHEIMNLVEKNVGTPAILVRTLEVSSTGYKTWHFFAWYGVCEFSRVREGGVLE